MQRQLLDLILVACHAPFKECTPAVPANPAADDAWVLQSFQLGEPPLYIEHARRGVELAHENPEALLVFSGGFTRREAGARWSEAATYLAIARQLWLSPDHPFASWDQRCDTEDYSRDSFENLLFSICRFQQVTGHYPRRVTAVSWEFKRARFDAHRSAIRFPAECWTFEGSGQPVDLDPALKNEAATVEAFSGNRYGSAGALAAKRAARNPLDRQHPFRNCPGLTAFFEFIDDPNNAQKAFPGSLPWD